MPLAGLHRRAAAALHARPRREALGRRDVAELAARRRAGQRRRLRIRVVSRGRGPGSTPSVFRSDRAGVERREPARDQPRRAESAVLHARARRGRPADPADELPSVPLRELAVHAQRRDLAVRRSPSATSRSRSIRRSTRTSAAPPTPRCCSTSPSRSGWPTIRSRRWATRSAWSSRPGTRPACSSRCRGPSPCRTARPLWAFRYSSQGQSRTLFHSADIPTLREMYPDVERLSTFGDHAQVVVSEPLNDLPGVFLEVPESTVAILDPSGYRHEPFLAA